jgi:hypothetical protein
LRRDGPERRRRRGEAGACGKHDHPGQDQVTTGSRRP